MWEIGELQGLLNPSSKDSDQGRLAWWLAACQRGYDCSTTADWVVAMCGTNITCVAGNNGEDAIQSLAGNKWFSVRRRAEVINEKLNAGVSARFWAVTRSSSADAEKSRGNRDQAFFNFVREDRRRPTNSIRRRTGLSIVH